MQKTIDEKNDELTDAKAEIPKLEDEYKTVRGKPRSRRLDQVPRASATRPTTDLASEQAKFQTERERMTDDADQAPRPICRPPERKSKERIDKINAEAPRRRRRRSRSSETSSTKQADKIEELHAPTKVERPNGEISWVNQRNRTVWINLGRADAPDAAGHLQRLSGRRHRHDGQGARRQASKSRRFSATTWPRPASRRRICRSHHAGRQDLYAAVEPRREEALRPGRLDGHRRRRPERPADRHEPHRHQRRRGRLLHRRHRQAGRARSPSTPTT